MRIKETQKKLRPREKALRFGLETLNDEELLCLIIGSGTQSQPVEQIAQTVLKHTEGLARLFDFQEKDLMKIEGIGAAKALQILSGLELSKRALKQQAYQKTIQSPEDIWTWTQMEYGTLAQEHFAVIYLDTKGHILRHKTLFIGTINQSVVHPREIFREAFMLNANSVLFIHNHPSGDTTPSLADMEATRKLSDAAKMCSIPIMDHVIVSKKNFYSFRAHSLLD